MGGGRTTQLAPACSAWRASSTDARTLGAPAPTKTGTAPPTSSTITSVSARRSSAESFEHLAGEPERDDPVRAAVERKAHDPPLRVEVDRALRRERRADRGVHAAPDVRDAKPWSIASVLKPR